MILLFGPVGAGKSIQGELLAQAINGEWLSTGQMFRASTNPEVQKILASGELIDDATTFSVVTEAITRVAAEKNIILDGFPRTVAQAEWLTDPEVHQLQRTLDVVVVLEVSEQVILERLSGRGRAEDTPETIARRMEIYHAATNPVLTLLEQAGVRVVRISGEGSVEEIHERIQDALHEDTISGVI